MDLDEDLLALAAGSEEEEGEEDVQQNDDSYSELADEVEEEEDDYYEEEGDGKSSSSRKKRKIASDEEEEDDESDGLKNPYPLEGKFKNDEDKNKIMAMDDLERELILFERSQELERFQERKYLELRAKKDKLNEEERKRSKKKGKTNTKADKRELLRQQRRKLKNKRRGYDDDDEDEDDEYMQDDDLDEYKQDDDEEYQVEDNYDYGFADYNRERSPEKETTLKDINNIHIGRKLFDKYSYYPEFTETVSDCYAKVNIGTNKQTGQDEYRMVQIKNIIERKEKVYTLVNKKTNLYAVVTIGKSERTIPMNIFSDRPITEQEYKIYTARLLKDHLELLSLRRIRDKYYRLREMARRNLTDKEITDMIDRREEIENDFAGVNHVMKKTNLQQQRTVALENEDFDTAEKLEQELKAMEFAAEASRSKSKLSNEQVLERVNERNKKLNQELVRKAELRAIEHKLTEQQKDDPFSRLKTRTKMFYSGGADKSNVVEDDSEEKLNRLLALKEKLEALEKERLYSKFRDYYGGFDEVIKSLDMTFDINV